MSNMLMRAAVRRTISYFRAGKLLAIEPSKTLEHHNQAPQLREYNTINAHYIQTAATSVKDLNSVLHLIAAQQAPSSLIGLVEERLLNLLTRSSADYKEDDMVSRYLVGRKIYDYNSLCHLFIKLAENRRRPTPLLRTASIELCKLSKSDAERPRASTIIATLNALVSLSYPNPILISKLINDLTEDIQLNDMSSYTICGLLRTLATLRWRPDGLLKMIYDHIAESGGKGTIDHHVMVALLQVTAILNYRPRGSIKEFYEKYMKYENERMLDKSSRKWLNYVWSLVVLNLASETHLKSVLNNDFCKGIRGTSGIKHSDTLKLLNLRAIALHEFRIDTTRYTSLNEMVRLNRNERSLQRIDLGAKIKTALKGVVNSTSELQHDIQTPFGFSVDCEILLDENMMPLPLDKTNQLHALVNSQVPIDLSTDNTKCKKCALIYASYEDTIANYQNEVVGYKILIARILANFGYRTIFVPETVIHREKTSADLTDRLKKIIESHFVGDAEN